MRYLLLGDIFSGAGLGDYQYLQGIVDFMNLVTVPVTVTLLIGAAVMLLILSVMIVKAESPDKAMEMKRRLIGMCITVVLVLVLIWVFRLIISNFGEIANDFKKTFNFSEGRGSAK